MEPLKKGFGGVGRRLLGGSAPREALSLTGGLPHWGAGDQAGSGFCGAGKGPRQQGRRAGQLGQVPRDRRVAFVFALEVAEGRGGPPEQDFWGSLVLDESWCSGLGR